MSKADEAIWMDVGRLRPSSSQAAICLKTSDDGQYLPAPSVKVI